MRCDVSRLNTHTTNEELSSVVEALNADPTIHGIIVQIPIPRTLDLDSARARIAPAKDVDCLNPLSFERLKNGSREVRPPVAESVKLLIETAGTTLEGRAVVVVGGGLFASQIAWHCVNNGANVTQIKEAEHLKSDDLRTAEIIISVVGKPRLITTDMVGEGAIVIDVGVSKTDAGIVGDVDFESVAHKVRAITPRPRRRRPRDSRMPLGQRRESCKSLVDCLTYNL